MKAIHHIVSHFKQYRAFYFILLINLLLTMMTIIMAQSCYHLDSMIHERKNYDLRSLERGYGRMKNQKICNRWDPDQIFAEMDPDIGYSEFGLCNKLFIPQANRNNLMIITAISPYLGYRKSDIKKIEFKNKG